MIAKTKAFEFSFQQFKNCFCEKKPLAFIISYVEALGATLLRIGSNWKKDRNYYMVFSAKGKSVVESPMCLNKLLLRFSVCVYHCMLH